MNPPRKKPPRTARQAPRGDPLRQQVAALLDWPKAHVTFEAAVAAIPAPLRGRRPAGLPHSVWQLVEHLRICQWDILNYCRNPDYREMSWPEDYWPPDVAPPTSTAWDASVAAFRRDLKALQRLTANPRIDLLSGIPHAPGVTYLRELLLVADHNAYHVGQIVATRRALGSWAP